MARVKKSKADRCDWVQDEDGIWNTACGQAFVLNDGTPQENSMRFCCYCGTQLRQRAGSDTP